MLLARIIRRVLVPLRSQTKPLILVLFATSRYFCPSHLSSLSIRRLSSLNNSPPPVTSLISYALPHFELRYFSFSDVPGFRSPSQSILISIVLRFPMIGERGFVFPKKIQGKSFYWIIFSTPANSSPVSQVTRWINIHSDWIARTTAA